MKSARTIQQQKNGWHHTAAFALAVLLMMASGTGGAVESSASLSDDPNSTRSRGREHATAEGITSFTLDNGLVAFDEQMQAALYGTHPYGVPVLGWFPEMQRLRVDDVNDFYQAWYAPNNVILIVAGEITAAQIKPLVQRYYGSIPSRPTPIRRRPPIGDLHVRRLVVKDARVCELLWKRMYLAPSYHAGDSKHVYALQILAELLVGRPTGYLFRHLVGKKTLATAIGIDYTPDSSLSFPTRPLRRLRPAKPLMRHPSPS